MSKLERQTSGSNFTCAPVVLAGGALMYAVTAAAVASGADNRDTTEFNMACAHFGRLTGKAHSAVRQVDVYLNPRLEERFRQMKDALRYERKRASGATWVFHGSTEANIRKIMVEGFRVGGKDGHPVANASKYGHGVYTANGQSASTALAYSEHGGCKQVILAKGLEGSSGSSATDVDKADGLVVDSWRPKDHWIVFADGTLLLPCYVVHYS